MVSEQRFPLVTEFIVRETSGINERRRRGEQKRKGKREDKQKMRRKEKREDDTDTPLVSLTNHMSCAQGYDLKISKLQLHSFC